MNPKDRRTDWGFKFMHEQEADAFMKDAFAKLIPFIAIASPIKELSASFVIQDKYFPYTGDKPAHPDEPGLRWSMQMGHLSNHLIFYNEIEDEDRTFERREFTLIFCPHYAGTNDVLAGLCSSYDSYHKKAKILIIGGFLFSVMTTRPNEVSQEMISHGNLMRHQVIGDVDISTVPLHLLTQMLKSSIHVDPLSLKYCPVCKKQEMKGP